MSNINLPGFQLYSEVVSTEIDWLWYPYIPFGKITLIQGDPGDGKSTMMMNIIGSLTNNRKLPDGTEMKPIHVMYQCSEDGTADTIKPRLIAAKADCDRIAFYNEDIKEITLDDEYLRKAIEYFHVRLLVIDPFQAYIGDAHLSSANCMRKILRRLGMWASTYNCAVVLIGHLNKKNSSKDLYRGLGSIDVVAAARSVLQIERQEEDSSIRILHHVKSSLAPTGEDALFRIDSNTGVEWINVKQADASNTENSSISFGTLNKQEKTIELLKRVLKDGPVEATVVMAEIRKYDICERTITIAKKIAGIKSLRKKGKWYWQLEEKNDE